MPLDYLQTETPMYPVRAYRDVTVAGVRDEGCGLSAHGCAIAHARTSPCQEIRIRHMLEYLIISQGWYRL